MNKYNEWLILDIEYPEDGDISDIGLTNDSVKFILENISWTIEDFWIHYYLLSDYFNELDNKEQKKIIDTCNIVIWDENQEDFDEFVEANASHYWITKNQLLEKMWF